jgi:hypothetical protein
MISSALINQGNDIANVSRFISCPPSFSRLAFDALLGILPIHGSRLMTVKFEIRTNGTGVETSDLHRNSAGGQAAMGNCKYRLLLGARFFTQLLYFATNLSLVLKFE